MRAYSLGARAVTLLRFAERNWIDGPGLAAHQLAHILGIDDSEAARVLEKLADAGFAAGHLTKGGTPYWRYVDGDEEPDGAALIDRERLRQLHEEGFTEARDDGYTGGELNFAAQAYCQEALEPGTWPAVNEPGGQLPPPTWPWNADTWRPGDQIRNLVKAGALIAAEIDRLQRAATR